MGVTISCTKTGRTIDVGSGGFLRLRSKISELVGEPWASHYRALVEERICDEKEREKFYEDFDKKTEALLNKKRISVKIVDFCLQSDCEGSIRYGACKELLKVIGNYDDNICYGYVVSLFSGAGILDWPFFKDERFSIQYAIDYDAGACQTYRQNIGMHIVHGDVHKAFTAEGFPLDNAVKAPDVIVGGPSCKPFSNANRHTRLEDHPDSDLLMQYMRIVETLNPKVFAIENVPEVLTACGGSYYAAVREKAESFGYELDSGIVQDCKVGGYTTRKRAVILGSRIGTPKLAHIALAGEYRTAGDAISKVDKSWSNYSDVTKPSSEVEKRMSFVPQGGNYTSIPEEYRTESKNRHSCTYRRLAWNEPSPTIVNWRKPPLIHPLENRTLTVAEAKALQGLPKDFRICGTLGQMQQQVGNSVPVAIGEFIKRCILRILQAQRQVQFA